MDNGNAPNYEHMFEAACIALAKVSRELGCDPNQGGAEPIIEAIRQLRNERDGWVDAGYAASATQGEEQDIGRAINRAAAELPEFWSVRIELERGCGDVRLIDPQGLETAIPGYGEFFSEQINAAIDAAMSAKPKAQ